MLDRSIATTLFTDIVGSTEKAAALGDRRWREVLRQHHHLVRAQLRRFGGQEIATAGDGFLAVFDNPARAIVCAGAIRDEVHEIGLQVRCGVHMGEIERSDGNVGGIAVHIGARVAAEAEPGEVLVSATVREAERGSDFGFEDRGTHALKGVPEELRLYALTSIPDEIVDELAYPVADARPELWERIGGGRLLRAVAIYLVVALAILALTRALVDTFDLPEWAFPTAGVLLLIGFAVITATAWVQAQHRTMVKAATGELPQGREIDFKGLAQAVIRGELPHLTWGRAVAGGVFAFALLFGLAGLYVVVQDRGRAFTPSEAIAEGAAPGIAVLPFSVQSAELGDWREGMVDLVSTNLDGVAGLRTIDSRTVLARWREAVPEGDSADLETALDVGRRAGARYVLLGSAVAIGGGVRLSADVYDTDDGSKLGQGTAEGAPDSVFALVDRLSIEILRAVLQGREGDLPGVNLARVTTASLPALKAYLEGEVLFREGDFEAAIPAYERAVEADSTFALAQYRLASAYGWSENIQSDLSQEAIERAARFADRLPERERSVVMAGSALSQGTLAGIEPLEEVVRRYPDDAEAWYLLGDTYHHVGEQALIDPHAEGIKAFARATKLDPTFAPAYIHQVEVAIYDGDSARAADLMATYDRLAAGSQTATGLRLAFALVLGDSATRAKTWSALDSTAVNLARVASPLWSAAHLEAQAEVRERQIRAAGPGRAGGATFFAAWVSGLRGRPAELLRTMESPEFPAEAAPDLLYYFHAKGLSIPPERLQQTLALESIGSEDPVHLLYAGAYAAERGEWDGHATAIRRLRESSRAALAEGDSVESRFGEGAAEALEGYAAWRRGQREEALRLLQASERKVTGHVLRYGANQTIRGWIGDLLEEMGRPSEAARYFVSVAFYDPIVWERLGSTYEELGELEEARAAYEKFLVAWRDAEPAMRPRVERVRQRLAGIAPLRRE